MKTYDIARATSPVPLEGRVDGTPWEHADTFAIEGFNWYREGPRPVTTGRALHDERALYLQFFVEDRHISATVTELNGPTYRDSSVEFFADPNPAADSHYFNFEPNCCGQFKVAWQADGWEERGIGRDLIPPDLAAGIEVRTSVTGPRRKPTTEDAGWWLAAALPFDVLSTFTGVDLRPTAGTEWRGNFYRSGVESASQKASWNPIETAEPDYHSPEYFGRLWFA